VNAGTPTPAQEGADSGQAPDRPQEDFSRELRIACWGGLLVLAIGYAALIPMKTAGELPREMTWIRVILGPALMVSLLPAWILTASRFPNRQVIALSILSLVFVVVVLGIELIDSALSR
jgi:hypothetical protein